MTVFLLADELFLVGHNEYSGKVAVNDEVLDIGLAGAALGELLLARRLDVVEGAIAVLDPRPWGEPVSDAILAEVQRRGGGFAMRAWAEHLRGEIREVLARRLVAAGVVRREESRHGLTRRVQVRYCGVDPINCTKPLTGAMYQLVRPQLLDVQTATLVGLILATGLDHLIILDMSRLEVRDVITAAVKRLPPQMRTLVADVDAAVTALAVMVRR